MAGTPTFAGPPGSLGNGRADRDAALVVAGVPSAGTRDG
jgi:hypothetical protein